MIQELARPEQGQASKIWDNLVATLASIGFTPFGAVLLAILFALPVIPYFRQEFVLGWLIAGAFLAAQAVAFDFTVGYIGIVNFGFAAILGLGAYTSAILANTSPVLALQPGISPWIGIFIGAGVAGLFGLGLGLLTLRLRGLYAAIMAWFVGLALLWIVRNWTSLTRGPLGLGPPSFLDVATNLPYFYIILVMMVVT